MGCGHAGPVGMALVEVMVTLVLLSVSAAGWWNLTQQLSSAVSATQLRDAAARLAQDRLEQVLRYRTSAVETPTAPEAAWAHLSSMHEDLLLDAGVHPAHLEIRVSDTPTPLLKSVAAEVSWSDRGRRHDLTLHTLASGVDPRLQAVAVLVRDFAAPEESPPAVEASSNLHRRVPLPRGAVPLTTRLAVLRPAPDSEQVWILDRLTGEITQSCWVAPSTDLHTLRVAHLEGCSALSGWWLSGSVRFADPDDDHPEIAIPDPSGQAFALDLVVRLQGTPDDTLRGSCIDDAPDHPNGLPRTRVRFHCRIQAWGTPPSWSGRIDIVPIGWTLGTTSADWRVCRYSADWNGNGRIDSAEHPATYVNVDTPLDDQNFLIVRGDRPCPAQTPAPGSGAPLLSTQAHQP